MVLDEDTGALVPLAQRGLSPQEVSSLRLPRSQAIWRCIVEKGRAVRCQDLLDPPEYERLKRTVRCAECLCFSPVEAKGEVIGLLGVVREERGFSPVDLEAFCALGSLAGIALENARLTEQLRAQERLATQLSRYFSPKVVEKILERPECCSFRGEVVEATVLVSDIAGFTGMAEKLDPHKTVEMLNQYLSRMVEIVFRHNGTVDKFTGDGLLAVFGAPFPTEHFTLEGVRAAWEMLEAVEELNRMWEGKGLPPLRMRVGVGTGKLLCGDIGSEVRMEFTVIGSTVNLAARLEGLNKTLGTQLLLCPQTYARVKEWIKARRFPQVTVRGLSHPMDVYTVEGWVELPATGGEVSQTPIGRSGFSPQ